MMAIVLFGLGLVALVAGAELLVRGASKLALLFRISPLVIGLTVVAFGTSSPELAVSVQSAWLGQVEIALGNVVGSNIFNILFILGLSALVAPLLVTEQLIRQEVPVMIGASVLLFTLALDGGISRLDGALLFGVLVVYAIFVIRQSRRASKAIEQIYTERFGNAANARRNRHWWVQIALVIAGLALLVMGSHWLLEAAIVLAKKLGLSEMVIGLTIVAAGTSLPEVATSVVASLRGERDIAIGNVVGSNIFNSLAVVGLTSLVAPERLAVQPAMLNFDMLVMIAVAVACLPILFTGNCISRWEGAVFLAYYVAYTTYLIMAAQQHDALRDYGLVMKTFVLPLTTLTLLIVGYRAWRASRR